MRFRVSTGRTLLSTAMFPADNLSTIFAAYSTRRLLTSYKGPAIRVVRSSDSAEQDIGFTPYGELDTSALTTFVGSGDGHIAKWYDQSGASRTLLPLSANLVRIVASGVVETTNSKPSVRGTASNQTYQCALSATTDYSVFEAFEVFSNTGTAYARFLTFSPSGGADWNTASGWACAQAIDTGTHRNTYINYGGTTDISVNAGVLAACYARRNADTSVSLTVGSTTVTSGTGRGSGLKSDYINLGNDGSGGTNCPVGYISEAVITGTLQSAPLDFLANQRNYWGSI